jgi:uncharacterized protein (DUF924 family)
VTTPAEILAFWFGARARPLWFERDPAFDAEIRAAFGAAHREAAAGRFAAWEATPDGAIALVILLDQFSRNIHRGTPRAFACDAAGLAVAERAIARGFEQHLDFEQRVFLYLPFEHSEDLADQRRGVALFRSLAEAQSGQLREEGFKYLGYALRHAEIIERFGRFPHRNQVLGRETTPAEEAFLKEPNSSF